MKRVLLAILLVFLVSVSMTGCAIDATVLLNRNKEDTRAEPDPNVMRSYREVLLNETEFFSTDSSKSLLLQDFLENREIYDKVFRVTRFAVLDMNGDKVPEVVLELSSGDSPYFFEVLHYYYGTVYGYLFSYRDMQQLKEDGVFFYSGGAGNTGIGKLKFEGINLKTEILGYSELGEGETEQDAVYIIEGERVNRKAFDAYLHEQTEKKDAYWYQFSEENIEALFMTENAEENEDLGDI